MRAVIFAILLAGCAAAPERPVEVVEVQVPVAVPCRAQLPEEPRWAMDAIATDADIDSLMRAALAEIEQRRGYEVRLLAALAACQPEIKP